MQFILMLIVSATTLLLLIPSATALAANVSAKIVGGTDTDIRDVPYQVSVRLSKREMQRYGSGHICGGTVLSQRMVATAAHCLYGSGSKRYRTAGEFVLVMGSSYLTSGIGSTLQFNVQQVTTHPNFNPKTLHNDIGVFFINGFIPWDSIVKPLPPASKQMKTNTDCLISGWGAIQTGGGVVNVLQSAKVVIVAESDCHSAYGDIPYSQICAGILAGGIDSCQGDSGGPLQCEDSLVGIVSYGRECAEQKYPGVYTNVVQYNDWLSRVNQSFDYSVFRSAAVQLTVVYHTSWLKYLCILFLAVSY